MIWLVAFHLATAAAPVSDPGQAVKALVLAQAKAWNAGDLDRFCAVYAEDATFVSPNGLTRGRGEVLARYRKRYPDRAAMGSLSFEFLETRALGSGGVSLVARWKLSYPEKQPAEGFTLIVFRPRGT